MNEVDNKEGEEMEEKVKRDELGRIIVAENVHFIINASIGVDRNGKQD